MTDIEQIAKDERAAIVAWLQNQAKESVSDGYLEDERAFKFCADSIERGYHMKGW